MVFISFVIRMCPHISSLFVYFIQFNCTIKRLGLCDETLLKSDFMFEVRLQKEEKAYIYLAMPRCCQRKLMLLFAAQPCLIFSFPFLASSCPRCLSDCKKWMSCFVVVMRWWQLMMRWEFFYEGKISRVKLNPLNK